MRRHADTRAPRSDLATALQDVADGAGRRHRELGLQRQHPIAQLLGPFERMQLAHRDHAVLHLRAGLVRAMLSYGGAVFEAAGASLVQSPDKSVASLATDPEALAQAREVAARVLPDGRNEVDSLVHDTGLFPRHRAVSSPPSQPYGRPARHPPWPSPTVRGGPGLFRQGRTRSAPARLGSTCARERGPRARLGDTCARGRGPRFRLEGTRARDCGTRAPEGGRALRRRRPLPPRPLESCALPSGYPRRLLRRVGATGDDV